MRLNEMIEKVADDMGMPSEKVHKIYYSYWKFIKTTIESLPLKKDLKFDEFMSLRTNFNIPRIGKLYCTVDDYYRIKYAYKKANHDKGKKDNSDVQRNNNHDG